MKPADPLQRVAAEVKSLYEEFHRTLDLLSETTDPQVQNMWKQDLYDLSLRAQTLLDSGLVDPIGITKLDIILARHPEQWFTLSKNTRSPLIQTH